VPLAGERAGWDALTKFTRRLAAEVPVAIWQLSTMVRKCSVPRSLAPPGGYPPKLSLSPPDTAIGATPLVRNRRMIFVSAERGVSAFVAGLPPDLSSPLAPSSVTAHADAAVR
jgi:hypothetical protein